MRSVLEQPTTCLLKSDCKLVSGQFLILCGSPGCHHSSPGERQIERLGIVITIVCCTVSDPASTRSVKGHSVVKRSAIPRPALEVTDQQTAKVNAGRHRRSPHLDGVELLTNTAQRRHQTSSSRKADLALLAHGVVRETIGTEPPPRTIVRNDISRLMCGGNTWSVIPHLVFRNKPGESI